MAMDKTFMSPQKVTTPNPSNPYHTQEDMSHLSSITSSTIFLHDGVLRSLNLKTLKDFRSTAHPKLQDAFNSTSDQIEELMALSLNDANSNSSASSSSSSTSNSSAELCKKIIKLSTLHVQSIGLHHRYQWYILEKTWRHQQNLEKSLESSSGILPSGLENTTSPTQLGFTLNLCLLIPMMEIYSSENRSVALSSLQLIFDELSSVPVGSLSQTSSISLEKLENLLVEWATNSDPAYQTSGPAAMIALACARGNVSSFAKTILMLENLQSPLRSLPVAAILKKLNDSRKSISKPCAIVNEKLITSWSYDDRLMVDSFQSGKSLGVKTHPLLNLSDGTEHNQNLAVAVVATTGNPTSQAQNLLRVPQINTTPASPSSPSSPFLEEINRHFMATDGNFLFVTGPEGKGLSKLGSGLGGTLQGWVYNNDVELYPGFLAYANDLLISRPFEVDNRKMNGRHVFGVTIDPVTLKSDKIIVLENTAGNEDKLQKPFMTLGMTSDGKSVYLVRAELPSPTPATPTTGSESSPASPATPPVVQIFMDIVEVISNPSTPYATAIPKFLGIPLNRQDDSSPPTSPAAAQGQADPDPQQQQQRLNNSNIPTVRRTRSVRLSSAGAPPPPPPPPPGTFPNSLEAFQTSLNFPVKQLQCSLYFTCGNFLTIVSSTNIHYFQTSATLPITLGPTLTASITSRQYCPVISASCSKVIGTQLHFQLDLLASSSEEIPAPPVSKQEWVNLNPDSCLYQGAILPEMAATYDPVNNVIWTCSGLYIDCWKNSGHVPPWKTNEMLLFPNSTNEDISVGQKGSGARNADIKTVTNVMLRHIGIMANHFTTGDKLDANIGFDVSVSNCNSSGEENETSCGVLKTMIDLVLRYRNQFEGPELTAILLSLKAIVSQVSRSTSTKGSGGLDTNSELYKDLYDVQVMLLCLLNDPIASKKFRSSSATTAVYHEACNLFADAFDLLYTTPESRNDFFQELYDAFEGHQNFNEFPGPSSGSGSSLNKGEENGESPYGVTGDSTEALLLLEDTVLQMFAKSLDNCSSVTVGFENGQKWIVDTPWLQRILHKGVEQVKGQIQAQAEKEFSLESVIKVTSSFPKASVSTMYINSVVNFLLRSLSIQNGSQDQQSSSRSVMHVAIEVFREVLKIGPTLVETYLECLSITDNPLNLAIYNFTECLLKSSVLALGIPQILAFLSLDNLPQNISLQSLRPLLDELTEEVIQLTVAMSFLAKKLNPGSDTSDSEDWSSRVKIFQPWNTKRSYESVHPVRDSVKVKDTIVYPKARQLYMKVNPQSASQYDYDRLTFHVPNNTTGSSSSKKILEFGGNYYGYGNRFFSGPGWARQVVKLTDGNSVSFIFDMKSGREHAVPDKALWGYQFTVFPVMDYSDQQKPPRSSEDLESMDPVNTGFTTVTALHCVDAIQNVVRGLLEGGDVTPEEKATQVLLENRLVASLKWSGKLKTPSEQPQVQRKFPTEVVQRVKRAVGVSPLQMRLSIIEKLKPMELEELYLQCCLLHVGANPYLSSETILSPACESCWSMDPTREILLEIFQNIDTLFRKMMAFYEMEKMLSQEIEEISSHSKDISETFFSDPSFLENPGEVETLAWICYLENDKENPGNVINDVTQMVLALAADGKKPELTRTDELIQETHDKCVYLLEAVPSPQTIIIGPVYPSQKMVIERLHSIHGFISSHLSNPNATVKTFISAVNSRRDRASDRIKGLDVLHKVLECSSPSSCLLVIASILLQRGPRVQTILCSGLEKEVIRIFGEVMRTAVAIAEKNPLLHRYSIALLSVTDYDRTDEENLVASGLVGVLDQLCAYQTGHLTPLYNRSSPTSMTKEVDVLPAELAETSFKASTLAWAAFQVLALQCASWERKVKSPAFLQDDWDDPEHRELPYQISINVTNHLARAAALAALSTQSQAQTGLLEGLGSADKQQSCSPGLSVAIQDVLDLLSNLRSYKIGRAILKQSPCICRLLGLLQDSRLSPRLVLTILKLLHTALPLVDDLDTANFKQLVPMRVTSGGTASGRAGNGVGTRGVPMSSFWAVMDSTPYTQVATMLLSKLADYLVCGSTTKVTPANPVCYTNTSPGPSSSSSGLQSSPGLTDSAKFERMEVWIHKTSGDNSTVIRQLFVDTPGGQELRPGRGTMHELENELNSMGKCLLYSEEASVAERKAVRISQMGFLTTLVPPGFHRPGQIPVTLPISGSRSSPETMCKEKNANLAAWDPARPFLSGHVAENLASEIVQLVRALLSPSGFIGKSDSTEGCSYGGISEKSEKSSNESLASFQGSICTGGDTESLASEQSHPVMVTTQKSQTQWPGAVQQVICAALKLLPRLMSLQNLLGSVQLESYVYSARMIIAALTVLGGFTETIRAGLEVWIVQEESKRGYLEQEVGSGFQEDFWEFVATKAKVISVSDGSPTAKVEIITESSGKSSSSAKPLVVSEILTVPTCRLVPCHWTTCGVPNLPTLSRLAQIELAGFLKTLLISSPQQGTSSPGTSKSASGPGSGQEFPLKKSLPTLQQIVSGANNSVGATTANGTSSSSAPESRQIAQAMTVIRLSAEIRTKSMQVLSLWLKRPEFLDIFLGLGSDHQFSNKRFSSDVMECSQNLKELSKLCVPSHKASSLERQVAYLRLLYRDCTKPPRLPVSSLLSKSAIGGDPSQMRWDLGRAFPKIRSTVFSSAFNSLVFTGDYNVSGGNPRGLVLFGSGPISSTSGYYWEATIVTMEEPGQHADLIVIPPLSIGYSPLPVNTAATSNDIWKYTSGTVMYTTLGRVVHYKGPDPGNWVTIRLDDTESMKVKSGDTIGVGWEKIEQGQTQEGQNQSARSAARNQSISLIESLGGSRRHRARSTNQIVDNVTHNSTSGVKGNVYFTLNGRRLPPTVEQSNCSLHPILHVQKKQMVVFTNFGERPFVFAEANKKTPQQKPGQDQDGILVPSSQSQGQSQVESVETGTSNADSVLLRRVSDSLQDLNLVFNISLHDVHSEQEMNQRPESATGSTLSGVSTTATRGDNDDRNVVIMDDDDTDDDPDVEADDWMVQVQMDDLEDMDVENDGDDDDDEDDEEDDGNNQRNNRSINRHPPTRMLPPSPTSGQSVSSILPGRRQNPIGKPPRKNKTKAYLRNASSLQSLESSLAGKKGSKKKNEVVAKAIQKTAEYNPIKSLEYFMGHSPTTGIRVFQGPPRYTCPCSVHCPTPLDSLMLDTGNGNGGQGSSVRERRASMDSLDSYEDDEEDDIHSLLVRAWEQQVFPVIRRRFRNESERRDGLEQIRGALQLGMLDIARQTVEFLYEEGGGIPRDLHFPTLEEVRQENARCSMDKLKPGMNVVIRPLQEQQQLDLGSVPGYAVSGMLRTFGLTGEVLEVDMSNELVFVETYLETEGVLVRFWYPVMCLDKSNSSKKPMLSTQTVNMFKLHSNLMSMESSLCKLYARQCYLSISEECQLTQKVNPVVTKISQDFDLDSIQILSDNCLSSYPASMDLFTYNLQCESPSLKFLQESGNPTRFFYRSDHDHAKISKKIREKIRQAMTSSSDTEDLNKLTQSMLSFMESGEKFPKQEIGLDRITDLEVSLPGAAFTLVTFKGPQTIKQMTQIDNTIHPCLHLSSYDSSDLSRHLMACYPVEPLHIIMHRASTSEDGTIISHTAPTTAGASNSSAASAVNKTMRKRHSRFPPVLCPTERLHCSISEINLPDILANVQGIPKEFPLALLFLQELVHEFHSNMEKCSNETVTLAVTQLLDFLDSFHLCPVVKDWIFAILAELTRLRGTSGQSWKPNASDKVARSSTPNRLFLELLLLRDKETSESSTPSHMSAIVNALSDYLEASSSSMKDSKGGKPFAPASLMFHISNFIASHQKLTKSGTDPNFSFYFNSLNDLCLALNEVSEIMVNPYEIIPCASNEPSPAPSPKPSTSNSSSAVIPLGALTDSTTAAGPPTPPNRRVYAKAIRRRPYNSNKDLRSALLQNQKDPKNQGKSGQGTSGQLDGGKKGVGGSSSEDGLLSFAKASEVEWFNNEVVITRVLRDIVWHSPQDSQCVEAGQVLIGTVLDRLKTSTVHNRLLVVHGAPVDIDGMSIEASLIKALRGCGGIHGTKMWISGNSAVVEIRALAKVHEAYDILKQNRVWYPLEDYLLYPPVSVFRVDEFLQAYSSGQGQGASAGTGATGTGTSALADLQVGEGILARFFRSKICSAEGPSELSFKGKEALSNIFTSCYLSSVPFVAVSHEEEEGAGEGEEEEEESGMRAIVLNDEQITFRIHGNLMDLFVSAVRSGGGDPESYLKEVLGKFGEKVNSRISRLPKFESDGETEKKEPDEKEKKKKEEKEQRDLEVREAQSSLGLSLQGFLDWCTDLAKNQPHLLWKGLLAAGYDLRLERVWLAEDSQAIYNYFHNPETWNLEKDAALIGYVDQFSQSLHIDPTRIQPPELSLTESDYLNPAFVALQGVDIAYLRVRWGMFQKINTLVSKKLLAHSSLHSVKSSRRSLANLLHDSRQLILYYIKDTYLYKIIHVSASRGSDTPTPEITIDPVSSIGTQDDSVFKKQLSQIIQQMSTITTSFYCVPPAQGADPALPLSVKFQGEEVPGLSGSFRHFLLQAVKELQSETVKLLCRCPSADAGKNKDNVIITPGKTSFGEEDFLYFLGQLIGISIRSDAPLALSLLKSTWRSLLLSEKESNDHLNDLMEADVLCATYLNKLDSLATKMTFDNFLSLNAWPKFQYPSMDNKSVVPLCPDGSTMRLNFGNRNEFINLVKKLREKELRCSNKVTKILTGLATIIPLPALLGLFTSEHLELRIAGSPEVNLSLLKSHTHYQVGVSENDPHIMYFWAALESFTPEELKKFIKFSCNLERLPITCPCQSVDHHQHHQKDGTSGPNSNVVHVPPFPMKIAPIDLPSSASTQDIDRRLIRVETCLFLIRLPPYSSLQVTRQQLLFAINCRDDPLSG